ncbi:hypothetical protein IAT38_006993 [Cryptococcus sp. DSM 104549]
MTTATPSKSQELEQDILTSSDSEEISSGSSDSDSSGDTGSSNGASSDEGSDEASSDEGDFSGSTPDKSRSQGRREHRLAHRPSYHHMLTTSSPVRQALGHHADVDSRLATKSQQRSKCTKETDVETNAVAPLQIMPNAELDGGDLNSPVETGGSPVCDGVDDKGSRGEIAAITSEPTASATTHPSPAHTDIILAVIANRLRADFDTSDDTSEDEPLDRHIQRCITAVESIKSLDSASKMELGKIWGVLEGRAIIHQAMSPCSRKSEVLSLCVKDIKGLLGMVDSVSGSANTMPAPSLVGHEGFSGAVLELKSVVKQLTYDATALKAHHDLMVDAIRSMVNDSVAYDTAMSQRIDALETAISSISNNSLSTRVEEAEKKLAATTISLTTLAERSEAAISAALDKTLSTRVEKAERTLASTKSSLTAANEKFFMLEETTDALVIRLDQMLLDVETSVKKLSGRIDSTSMSLRIVETAAANANNTAKKALGSATAAYNASATIYSVSTAVAHAIGSSSCEFVGFNKMQKSLKQLKGLSKLSDPEDVVWEVVEYLTALSKEVRSGWPKYGDQGTAVLNDCISRLTPWTE